MLRVATHGSSEPMHRIKDNELVGYDIGAVMPIARELHMGVELSLATWGALPSML